MSLFTKKQKFEGIYFERGWDGEDAEPINREFFEFVISLIKKHLLEEGNLECFELGGCRDGSIDLEWNNEKIGLVINIKDVNNTFVSQNLIEKGLIISSAGIFSSGEGEFTKLKFKLELNKEEALEANWSFIVKHFISKNFIK